MALSANTVLEVRTTGSDTNGGGFVTGSSGTDWSQQDTAQYSVTDGVTNGTTTITSATASFGTDVVGNLIYVAGGTGPVTATWKQIISRTNSTTIVVDSSTGLTSGTGVTLKIGGALATPGAAGAISAVTGMITFHKYNATPITLTTATVNTPGGPWAPATTALAQIQYIGYDTTRTVGNTDSNRPTVKAGANSTTLFSITTSSTGCNIRNVIADANSKTGCIGFTDGGASRFTANFCKATGMATGFSITGGGEVIGCESVSHTTAGFTGAGFAIGSIARSGSAVGFSGLSACSFCISQGNTGAAGFTSYAFGSQYLNCLAYGNGSHGFDLSATFGRFTRGINLASYGNGGYGFNCGAETMMLACAAGSNTSGSVTGSPILLSAILALTSDPCVNAAGGNFSLNSTAGAGALLRAAGWPGVFPGGTTTGYLDIGAAQHQDSGGSSGTPAFVSIG